MHPYRFMVTRMAARATTRAAIVIVGLLAVIAPVLMSAAPAQAQGAVTLRMVASLTTLPVGNVSTLTVTASSNLSPTPWYIQIYDTTGPMKLLNPAHSCGNGTICSWSVSQPVATTHTYRARLVDYYGNVDPGSDSNTSYVTWTGAGWQLFLSAGPGPNPFSATLFATTNHNVGPTPYYISIFKEDGPNRTAGTLLATCGTGTSCQTVVTGGCPFSDYVAFVNDGNAPLNLSSIQASSNIMTVYGFFCFPVPINPTVPSPIPTSPTPPQQPKG